VRGRDGRRRRRPSEPPEDPGKARDERRQRARDEALDVQERDDRAYRSFEVRNPVHGTHYRVLAPEAAEVLLCPCPDFGRRDVGTCKHVEAVLAHLRSHPASPPPAARPDTEGTWRRIEAAVRAYPALPLRSLAPLWEAGRLLRPAPGP